MLTLSVEQIGAPSKCRALSWATAAGCSEAGVAVRRASVRSSAGLWASADRRPAPRPFSCRGESVCVSVLFVQCSVVSNLPVIVSSVVLVS